MLNLLALAQSVQTKGGSIIWENPIRMTQGVSDNLIPTVMANKDLLLLSWRNARDTLVVSSNFGDTWRIPGGIDSLRNAAFFGFGSIACGASTIYYAAPVDSGGAGLPVSMVARIPRDDISTATTNCLGRGQVVDLAASGIYVTGELAQVPGDTFYGVRFSSSSDNGEHWTMSSAELAGTCYGISQQGQRLYITRAADSLSSLEVEFRTSTDGGMSWNGISVLSSVDGATSDMAAIAGDGTGNVYAAWRDGKYGSVSGWGGAIIIRKSSDFGLSWGPENVVSSERTGVVPKIAVDGSWIAVCWDDEKIIGSEEVHTIHCRVSPDYGASWSDENVVSSGTKRAVDADVAIHSGRIVVAYSDSITDGDWFHYETYVRYGRFVSAGGISYATNELSEVSLSSFPNPFNGTTTFRLQLPKPTWVSIKAYDQLGRVVDVISQNNLEYGVREFRWQPAELSSGIYFIVADLGYKRIVMKVQIIR